MPSPSSPLPHAASERGHKGAIIVIAPGPEIEPAEQLPLKLGVNPAENHGLREAVPEIQPAPHVIEVAVGGEHRIRHPVGHEEKGVKPVNKLDVYPCGNLSWLGDDVLAEEHGLAEILPLVRPVEKRGDAAARVNEANRPVTDRE